MLTQVIARTPPLAFLIFQFSFLDKDPSQYDNP
jgi:hypothetical protein